ncbi:MAG: A/G-specific adenine glycosylase [Candidatus Longimicrobiales bacterium M2_2A_002]
MPSPKPHEIARALLTHFDAHRRAMPWRETSDPYAIWVSEVMLQQTRVETVVPYWTEWMERFPTVDDLADADLDDVLKRWEGLGYYSRARNLHGAARMVRERFGGRVPETVEELRELPGVGEYTAGAVASIAHGVPTPAVDGNVRRVLSRLYDLEAPTAAELRSLAADLVPADRPGDFNQALMELGATVCTPRSPDCDACPLAGWCEARRLGVQEQRPRPKARKAIPEETVRTVVIARDDGVLLLVRRPEDGLLGGLWEFPGSPAAEDGSGQDGPDEGGRDWSDAVSALIEASVSSAELDPVVHTFSHKRVTYEPVLLRVRDADATPGVRGEGADDAAWVPPARLAEYALPVAQQKIARWATARLQR